jgi:pimeloyl-ACP methyl ester carboxylesterase
MRRARTQSAAATTDFSAPPAKVFHYDVEAADGTRLRAWTNDPDLLLGGPTVLVCNGLGTSAWAMPALLDPACSVRVISWDHRGTGGSDRPRNPDAVTISDFVDDAIAVLDDAGVERATLLGWSMGVNTAFELTALHPDRVDGVVAVAGVPGGTFGSMLGPLHLPPRVAHVLTVGAVRLARHLGSAMTPISRRIPVGPRLVWLLSHSGLMFPPADPANAVHAIREFLRTPVDWYFHLALHAAEHAPVDLSLIEVPTLFIAGRWDVLAGARDMARAAGRLPDARYVELAGSHFLTLEQPHVVHDLLVDFLHRLAAAPR